jgi:hypothetical protein
VTPDPSIERTDQSPLRGLWSAAHVERQACIQGAEAARNEIRVAMRSCTHLVAKVPSLLDLADVPPACEAPLRD